MLRTPASLSSAPTSTFAGLPAAAAAQGQLFRLTDVGPAGVGLVVISDGTRWLPLGPQVLDRSAVGIATPGDTNEDVLATIAVPAGLMGLHGSLRIRAQFSYTNSANNKTPRVRFGGAAGTVYATVTATATTYAAFDVWLGNRGAANSQIGGPSGQSSFNNSNAVAAATTSAVDTSGATSVVISGQKASAGEVLSLDRYLVEIWP